jgi:PhnB protein
MAKVSTYLNFGGNCEEAFNFYRTVFKVDFNGPITRLGDLPPMPGMPEATDEQKQMVINVAMTIMDDYLLQGADVPTHMGKAFQAGNNAYTCLHPDTREEADRLFTELSNGGTVEMPMADQFWGDYFGSFQDQFGIWWMINCSAKA